MSDLLSQDQAALKMLFTEDIYLIDVDKITTPAPVLKPESTIKAPAELKMQPEIKVPSVITPEAVPATADFEYLGENNKYFLILIDDKIHTRINPVHQEMLLKIMNAKKMGLRDLAIVNISRYHGTQFTTLKSFFSCSRLALFGVSPTQIGLPALGLNKTESASNVKILATYSLEEMRNSPDKKREFWNIMKNF